MSNADSNERLKRLLVNLLNHLFKTMKAGTRRPDLFNVKDRSIVNVGLLTSSPPA